MQIPSSVNSSIVNTLVAKTDNSKASGLSSEASRNNSSRLQDDKVTLSSKSKEQGVRAEEKQAAEEQATEKETRTELSQQEQRQVVRLSQRDAEVKAHELAHKSVGGQYAGAISYDFQVGPDGKRYAVGGEVPIDTSRIKGDPQATIEKMAIVMAAANAPANPSPQDRSVAAAASQIMSEARAELAAEPDEVDEKELTEEASEGDAQQKQKANDSYTEIEAISATGPVKGAGQSIDTVS